MISKTFQKKKGESKMSKFGKYFLLVTGFVLLATFARIPGAVMKVHAHNRGCSVASIKGKYAFRRMGVNNFVFGPNCIGFKECGPIAVMGVAFYGGDGTRGPIRITRSNAGEIIPWDNQPGPNGTYTVDPDCTGSFFDASGEHSNDVVVVDGGKRIFLLSEEAGTTVMDEGIRLEEEEKD